jgi:PAS domain S-box-containing protein
MLRERQLLSPVRTAVSDASDRDDLQQRVCEAVVDAGYDYAYLYGDEHVLAAAGVESPVVPTERPALGEPEVAAADAGREVRVPVSDGDERFGTLAFAVSDAFDVDANRTQLLDVGGVVGLGAAKHAARAEREVFREDLKRERRQFRKLHSVAAQMVNCEHEQSIYHLAMDAAENILDFDICSIDIEDDGFLVPVAISTGMEEDDSERFPNDEGVVGETFQENKRIVIDDVAGDNRDADPTNPDYESVLSVPIEDIGVFQAAAKRTHAFSERDAELAELLMAHVGETLRRLWSDEALRESEEKYRTLIEQSHDAVTIHQHGGYEFVNQRGTELFGRGEEEILDLSVWDVVHPEDADKLADVAETESLALGERQTFEARIERPDGDVRHCEFSTTVISYQGDTAVLASIRDITERKERERELERQNERLDQFASVVSHDLRSPLNVAKGSLDLAEATGEAEHFDRASEALDRMESLVEDVLELARQGQLVDETEAVSLADVVHRAWGSIDAPDATLNAAVDDKTVAADSGRLQELFENLFRNAVEHGGEDVTVSVTPLSDGFAVVDDGPGVPDGAHDDVFERGYTSADDGTGFGLAIVREIADAHDWDVAAVPPEEDTDRGARFEIRGVACPD